VICGNRSRAEVLSAPAGWRKGI